MALLFMDSFNHYATADLTTKWTSSGSAPGNVTTSIAAGGRRGSGSLRLTVAGSPTSTTLAFAQKVLAPGTATAVVGCAIAVSSSTLAHVTGGNPLVSVRDGATAQVTLRLNADLTLSVLRGPIGGTVLGTSSSALSAGVFAFVEWKVAIHPTAGTVDLRINGVSVLSLTGQNTRNTANTSWTSVTLNNVEANAAWNSVTTGGTIDYDDLYVLDSNGAAPWNDFLGDCRVDAILPTAAGATTGWTPSAGANWQCVDEPVPNGDTDFTSATTIGLTDTFVVQDIPVAGSVIYGVQHNLSVKKMDAGAALIAPVIRHGGVDFVGADIAPGTTYAYGLQVAAVNPGTGAQWTEAGFNAAEFGYRKTG
jgi:hypothetical protein